MPYNADVLRGFRFTVSFDQFSTDDAEAPQFDMGFMKISGLQADVGVYEWQEVTDPVTIHKLPDRIKFSDLILERGVASDRWSSWDWFLDVEIALADTFSPASSMNPYPIRSDLTITAYDKGANDFIGWSAIWKVFSAFPRTVKFGEFDAQSSSVVIESLTLAHEGYRRLA
jgi:phage tail-like protein